MAGPRPCEIRPKMPEGKAQSNRPAFTYPHSPFRRSDFQRLNSQMMVIGGQVETMLFWLDGCSHIRWGIPKPDQLEKIEASRNVGIRYC